MSPADTLRFATRAATAWPLRTALMMLAMSIGVAAVVVLTALGDGARRYVVNEFSALGASLLIVLPGRTETGGRPLAALRKAMASAISGASARSTAWKEYGGKPACSRSRNWPAAKPG